MQTIKLSTKGTVSLPPSMLTANAWAEGTEFTVENTDGRVVLTPLKLVESRPKTKIEDLIGCMGYVGKNASIEDMNEFILTEAAARYARS